VLGDVLDIVHQEAYSDPPICRVEQGTDKKSPRFVVLDNKILEVQSSFRLAGQFKADEQAIDTPCKQMESGLRFLRMPQDGKIAPQTRLLRVCQRSGGLLWIVRPRYRRAPCCECDDRYQERSGGTSHRRASLTESGGWQTTQRHACSTD